MRNLLAMCAAAAVILFASCGEQTTTKEMPYNQGINVIPAPLSLVENEGTFKLNKNTTIYASIPELKTVAGYFTTKLSRSTGYKFTVDEKEVSNGISLVIDQSLDVNNEGYTLDVTNELVSIKAKTPAGIFYGMQTFMQLLPAEVESPTLVKGITWTAPAVSVKDEPRFGYRGMMLDPCRHFMTVEEVKKNLDVIALFKLNRMHWHLTDDQGWRIEIKKYPELTEIGAKRIEGEGHEYGGYYTQEEIKEVVQYAAERFITIIPEIELPGHGMAAIAAYPELSCKGEQLTPRIVWGVEDIVFCAGKEEPFEFLENVFKEVIELFPSEYIHIGGDECPKRSWKQCPLCQKRIKEEGLKGDKEHSAEERLQSYFVQRMEKVLAKYGKKIIGWDEILEGGLAPTATVMSWRGEQGGIAAAKMDHDVIMTPQNDGMYLDRYEGDYKIEPVSIGGFASLENVYDYNPTPAEVVANGKEKHILGVQCNTWSEYMYTNDLREYRIYPRILALAETAWTKIDRKNYKDFERRLNNAQVRLDEHNINYYIPQPEQPNGSCNFVAFTDKASLEFTTGRPVKMVYTTDGSEPTPESTEYTAPIEFTESGVLKIRSVLVSGKMSKTRVITVEKQEFAPAKEVDKTSPGLQMQVTYGYFLNVDELAKATEWKSSTIKDLPEMLVVEHSDEGMRGIKYYSAVSNGYIDIPEDNVYYFATDFEEVWIDGKLLINNRDEVKRFPRTDRSVALGKGLHEFKVVFLSHIIGGWPSIWNNWHRGTLSYRKANEEKFQRITPEMLVY
ncbi:hexosaminidase [Parabacteroides sp. PF5-5]|uniref:family 20 glycosylhydrolase n=1 Tax=unclassified Parabacteroides TaxID=2649774 RepID=UPI0024741DEE|nr:MULTISPECIES: family 20 glycosylhydrolase [unclassified Parabacteroides]MDH6304375.1 hexosaminidase [Parabacteroides sp. PH5-39]MDH6315472.1 hexosaminidase [Parabacteroides sp. PF5-13]MDH6319034.1 hexosaminidase [Parabacteroides sp. PH5-13]MDH6322764.1 hexosaminidase [Parabacteroides sp. PH5-8]MDH6326664.1 hexosaminidase [Parabacteroides sp. PH5-41]